MIEKWSGFTSCATAGSLCYAEQLKAETVLNWVLLNSCSLLNSFSFFFFPFLWNVSVSFKKTLHTGMLPPEHMDDLFSWFCQFISLNYENRILPCCWITTEKNVLFSVWISTTSMILGLECLAKHKWNSLHTDLWEGNTVTPFSLGNYSTPPCL